MNPETLFIVPYRKREKDRQTEADTDRQTEADTDRKTEADTDRKTEAEADTDTHEQMPTIVRSEKAIENPKVSPFSLAVLALRKLA